MLWEDTIPTIDWRACKLNAGVDSVDFVPFNPLSHISSVNCPVCAHCCCVYVYVGC